MRVVPKRRRTKLADRSALATDFTTEVTEGGEGCSAGWPADQLPVALDSAMSSIAFATASSA